MENNVGADEDTKAAPVSTESGGGERTLGVNETANDACFIPLVFGELMGANAKLDGGTTKLTVNLSS